ncbi:hypothetical protein [Xenorhabdus cabanillasii]|uniref:hypothetical protein n=1 Tax=Xenorhabdus cabanillasii TaxID=351673 RepID=UPI001145B33B|nr:hypothetical protein [Xenorhabdus cabanillasii]
MRYICALLEADITGHITHRPAMKVYRSYAPAYHPLPAEWYLPRSDRYCFNRYNIHRHDYPQITNVPKTARRHLRKRKQLPSDAAGRQTSRAQPDWLYDRFELRITQCNRSKGAID